jgi:soluble lytic murein transglycosylase-like protein
MNAVGNIAAMKVAQSMRAAEARFAEIEARTGMSFSTHMMRAQRIQATGGRSPVGQIGGENDFLYDHIPSSSQPLTPMAAPAYQTGGFGRLPESAFDELIANAAERYGLEPALLKAICYAESNFRPDVVSRAGAMGLMQLMPATAAALGVTEPFDPWQNMDGGARYIAQQLDRFNGNALLAIAAYNCGYNRVNSRGVTDLTDPEQRLLLPQETQGYLARIEAYLDAAQASYVLDSPYAA